MDRIVLFPGSVSSSRYKSVAFIKWDVYLTFWQQVGNNAEGIGDGAARYMITILHHNNFVTKKDPFAENKVDTVDIFNWENLELSHLRLSSTVSKKIVHKRILCYKLIQGAVPVLVSEEGIPLTGENIYQHLNKMSTPGSNNLFSVFRAS